MDYIETNKEAWEEAFENRQANWGDDNHARIKSGKYAMFDGEFKKEIESIDFRGKTVAHFCCNNGRELLSLLHDSGAIYGVGFDIAENILMQAKETAIKAGITNCEFVNCNILDIPESYYNRFDYVLFTIGALCWFQELTLLFDIVGKCLKDGGIVIINDTHPFVNMLAMPEDDGFNANDIRRFTHSYFRKEPWISNCGMGYISGEYKSKTFIDFSHTFSDIINALSAGGMKTVKLTEQDYDIGTVGCDVYDGKGIPLSYILLAVKI